MENVRVNNTKNVLFHGGNHEVMRKCDSNVSNISYHQTSLLPNFFVVSSLGLIHVGVMRAIHIYAKDTVAVAKTRDS